MYGFPPLDSRSRLPKRQRGAVRPTKPHPSCTKMSLTLVFAPVEVLEEMAAALPVSLHPLSYKIRQQTDFNVFFVVFLGSHARAASGTVFISRGAVKGLLGIGRTWLEVDHPKSDASGCSGGGGQGSYSTSFCTHGEETWPRLPDRRQREIRRG